MTLHEAGLRLAIGFVRPRLFEWAETLFEFVEALIRVRRWPIS
jgi:hypothetical protein